MEHRNEIRDGDSPMEITFTQYVIVVRLDH